jgi:hypothetical protein
MCNVIECNTKTIQALVPACAHRLVYASDFVRRGQGPGIRVQGSRLGKATSAGAT